MLACCVLCLTNSEILRRDFKVRHAALSDRELGKSAFNLVEKSLRSMIGMWASLAKARQHVAQLLVPILDPPLCDGGEVQMTSNFLPPDMMKCAAITLPFTHAFLKAPSLGCMMSSGFIHAKTVWTADRLIRNATVEYVALVCTRRIVCDLPLRSPVSMGNCIRANTCQGPAVSVANGG